MSDNTFSDRDCAMMLFLVTVLSSAIDKRRLPRGLDLKEELAQSLAGVERIAKRFAEIRESGDE